MGCPGCRTEQVELVERVLVEDVAAAWARQVPEAADAIRSYVSSEGLAAEISTQRCLRCGLQFFEPAFVPGPDWYAIVEEYPDRWEHGETVKNLIGREARVLELGCGDGRFLARAREAGIEATGIDFNAQAVARARAAGLEAYTWDLREIADRMGSLPDAVAMFHVIEHVEDLDAFFADLATITQPGTQLHFSCPSPTRYPGLFPHARVGLREPWDYPPHHQTRWCRSAVEALLSRMGWRLARYAEEPFGWRETATVLALSKTGAHGPVSRRAAIARSMLATIVDRYRYSGTSMYCLAVRL